jgi:hypothetical protein
LKPDVLWMYRPKSWSSSVPYCRFVLTSKRIMIHGVLFHLYAFWSAAFSMGRVGNNNSVWWFPYLKETFLPTHHSAKWKLYHLKGRKVFLISLGERAKKIYSYKRKIFFSLFSCKKCNILIWPILKRVEKALLSPVTKMKFFHQLLYPGICNPEKENSVLAKPLS